MLLLSIVLVCGALYGHRREQPPADPMTFDEAKRLIRRIVRSWLSAKVEAA